MQIHISLNDEFSHICYTEKHIILIYSEKWQKTGHQKLAFQDPSIILMNLFNWQ